MFFKCIPTGLFESNCYIIGSNGEAVIIDAGVDTGIVLKTLDEAGLKAKYIILTHAHIDHILNFEELKEKTGAVTAIHCDDSALLSSSRLNGSWLIGVNRTFRSADLLLKENDILKAGDIGFTIIHTPGHTPGGISIRTCSMLFTGDTMFRLLIGRTDLGAGDEELLDKSLQKLMQLVDDVAVYPGHGPSSTIGYERRYNPYIRSKE